MTAASLWAGTRTVAVHAARPVGAVASPSVTGDFDRSTAHLPCWTPCRSPRLLHRPALLRPGTSGITRRVRYAPRVTWLVTGGAGYIGAHVVRALLGHGLGCVVVDDLSTGLARRLPSDVPVHVLDVADTKRVAEVMVEHSVAGVIHLAAKKSPTESVSDPLRYYRENVGGVVSLLTAMTRCDVPRVVFSSSGSP